MTEATKNHLSPEQLEYYVQLKDDFQAWKGEPFALNKKIEEVEQEVEQHHDVCLGLLMSHLIEAGGDLDALDIELLTKIVNRFMNLRTYLLLTFFIDWLNKIPGDKLKGMDELYHRMLLGVGCLFDYRKFGVGEVSPNEQTAIKELNEDGFSVRRLARIFRRSESTIMKYK